MIKLALRDVWAHFTRFILTILSVVLGVAFLSGTLALRADLEETFVQSFASSTSGTIQVEGQLLTENSNSRAQIPAELVEDVRGVVGVEAAEPVFTEQITILDEDGSPITGIGVSTVAINTLDGFWPWTINGPTPTGINEIAFEGAALERYGFKVGDQIEFLIAGERHSATIVSTIAFENEVAILNITALDQETLLGFADEPVMVSAIAVQTREGDQLQPIIDRISSSVGGDYTVRTTEEVLEENADSVGETLGFITTFLLVFVILALGVSTFIIGNTFHMAVKARQKEFAYLRAVGASPGQIFFQVAVQALVIGLVGSGIGLLLGIGLLALASWALLQFGMAASVTTSLPPSVIVISLIVGTLVTFIGAILPARAAAQTPPVEAMREVSGVREAPLAPRALAGIALVIIGIIGIYLGAERVVDYAGTALGVGSGLVVIGALVASPALVTGIVGALAWPLRKMSSVVLRVGAGNTVRNPRRTAATAGALIIGMGLVSLGTVLASSVQASTEEAIESQLHADLMVGSVTPGEEISDETVELIKQAEGVASVNADYDESFALVQLDDAAQPMPFTVVNPTRLGVDFDTPVVTGELESLNRGEIVVSKPIAERLELTVGDTVTIVGNFGPQEVTVGGIHEAMLLTPTSLITPETVEELGLETSGRGMVVIFVDEGAAIETVQENIRVELTDLPTLAAYSKDDMKSEMAGVIDTVLAILYALLALSIAVAILGIVNTLGLAVSERTTEIALMRAIGTSRPQMAGTILIEAILTSVYGTIIGMVVGLGISVALVRYTSDVGINVLSIPWGTLAIMLVGAVLIGIVAAIGPAWRAARQPILDAIVSE
ncbi:MAG: ABC transporter permease [Actinomycetaceae bacterium]|nr:ABC transporter permease [Actinomycetaceae bacterium]